MCEGGGVWRSALLQLFSRSGKAFIGADGPTSSQMDFQYVDMVGGGDTGGPELFSFFWAITQETGLELEKIP